MSPAPPLAAFSAIAWRTPGLLDLIFLAVAAAICLYHAARAGFWSGIPTVRYAVPTVMARAAIDLLTLLVVHQGVAQALIEKGRGSWLGGAICLLIVTPLLALLVRGFAKLLVRGLLPGI